jgi:hypothetical protein
LRKSPPTAPVSRYAHIFIIVEENMNYDPSMDPATAPHIAGLAKKVHF